MGLRTIEPDGTIQLDGWTVTVAASAHLALSDEADSTYVRRAAGVTQTGYIQIRLANPAPAIPVTAQVRGVTPTIRYLLDAGNLNQLHLGIFRESVIDVVSPATLAPTAGAIVTATAPTLPYAPDGDEWTVADLDDLIAQVQAESLGGSTTWTVRWHEIDVDVTYNEIPVTAVTGPADDDAGAAGVQVTTTSQPVVTFTYSDPDGDVKERHEVRVYEMPAGGWAGFNPDTTTEVPVWTSGVVLSAALSATVGVALENLTNYRAYVRVGDVTPSGFSAKWSAWAFREFDMTLSPPPLPTIVTAADTDARVRIELTAGAGTPTTELFTLERSLDGGATWATLWGSPITNTGGTVVVYDTVAPRDTSLLYRTRAIDTSLGTQVQSAAVTAAAVTLANDGDTYLKSVSDPAFSLQLCHADTRFSLARAEDQAVYEPEGRADPIIIGGTVRMRRGALRIVFDTDADFDAFEALRARQEKLFLMTTYGAPTARSLWVRLGADLEDTMTATNQSVAPGKQLHVAVIEFREVAAPAA